MGAATTPVLAEKRAIDPVLLPGAIGTHAVARQPILDENHRVQGYELHFHAIADSPDDAAQSRDPQRLLDEAVVFGLERYTGGLPAFVRCTAEMLTGQLVSVLSPTFCVIEIPAKLGLEPDLVEECAKLKAAGYRLALVDFASFLEDNPLLPLVKYVKFDLARIDVEACRRLRQKLHGTPRAMIADNVQTQADYRKALEEGFTLFQGYYFCHPELVHSAKIPANRLFHMQILRQLQMEPLDIKKISPMVMRDAALTYRLLRLVNSPIYARRQEIRSIESAIMIVGETTFRRIAMLAILSEVGAKQPPEILHMALVRARFCELAAPLCGLDPQEQYLMGLLSLLPAMMLCPMATLVKELPLRAEIRDALLGAESKERCLLAWIEDYEYNNQTAWSATAEAYGLNQQKLVQLQIDALIWEATVLPPTA